MIPIRLTITNFLSYGQTQSLNFSGFDLAVLSGPNGAGKSSLLEAITWCLWEQSRAGSSDDLVHQGQQSMWVEFVFEHEGGIYRVLRKRDKKSRGGTTTLEFQLAESLPGTPGVNQGVNDFIQWQSLTEGTIRQTQEKILKTLRLPHEIFVNSSYLRQGHADEFTVKPPGERKQILAEILGLSQYDELEQKAKKQHKQAESRLEVLKLQSEELSKGLKDKDQIAQNAQNVQIAQNEMAKEIQKLEADYKKHLEQKNKYDLLNQQITHAREQFLELAQEIKESQNDQKQITIEINELDKLLTQSNKIKSQYQSYQKLQKEIEEYNHKLAEVGKLRETLSVLEHKQATVSQTIERIKHISTCPTCLRPMSTTEGSKVIQTLQIEFSKADGPNLEKINTEIAKIGYDKNKHQKLNQELRIINQVTQQYQQLLVAENSKKEKLGQLEKIKQMIKKAFDELKTTEKAGLELKAKAEKLKEASQNAEQLELKLQSKRLQKSQLDNQVGELTAKLKHLDETIEKIKKWQEEITTLQEEISIWDELAQAFSKKGIQTMIIEQTLPVIEEKANELLKRVSDGRMTVQFITQKTKKTAVEELIETLEIVITDELGSRNYELFSGGEAFRINFAIRVALAKLLAVRSGAKLQFLVIDEGFGMLDTAGRDDIVSAINSIRDDFKKIIVVSHVPELKDAFQTRLEVSKDSSGSNIHILT